MKTLRSLNPVLWVLITFLFSASQASSRDVNTGIISLDCTVKGGMSDGAHMLISINPHSKQVIVSGMTGVSGPDIVINDNVVVPDGLPSLQSRKDSSEELRPDPDRDPIYDGRPVYKTGFVRISKSSIKFGYNYWIPAMPAGGRPAIAGPQSNFTIDRRTGTLQFFYDGKQLFANCEKRKQENKF